MTPNLRRLVDRARLRVMTPEELCAQRISFAYGNVAIENPRVTRELVERIAKELESEP